MKTEDFDRLKAVCEKEGFEIESGGKILDRTLICVKPKDIWDGVEFVQLIEDSEQFKSGKIFKVLDTHKSTFCRKDTYFKVLDLDKECIWIIKHLFKPSTESAYVEQLKKEALERFPNIKEGDIIKTDWTIDNVKISKGVSGFCYIKYGDMFLYNTTAIYKEGKWAERVNKRIEVTYSGASCKPHPMRKDMDIHEVRFYVNHTNGLPTGNVFDFLASQLEKYLNGEIE